VDHIRVLMYWELGRKIVEEEQQGKHRATYGEYILKRLSAALLPTFGTGFSYRQLAFFRQFFNAYPIVNALCSQFTWSHYRLLLRINSQSKRDFYETESFNNNWSSRQLERQINSQLYERLLLSNSSEDILAVARSEKHPVDAKAGKITHQDIGQLQMYVNYHDRFEKKEHENSTIGILLCADKNDAVVKITLPENNQTIVANRYQLYLPTEEQLLAELKKIG
jgi:hypothetical protein